MVAHSSPSERECCYRGRSYYKLDPETNRVQYMCIVHRDNTRTRIQGCLNIVALKRYYVLSPMGLRVTNERSVYYFLISLGRFSVYYILGVT